MKTFKSIWQVSALALTLAAATANAGGWLCALDEALASPKPMSTIVEYNEHKFLVRPVQVHDGLKSQHTLTGTIEREVKSGKKDVINYRIVKQKGVKEITFQINDGKWQTASAPLMKALGNYAEGKPMTEEQQNETIKNMHHAVDKSWEQTAEFLIATIAARHC